MASTSSSGHAQFENRDPNAVVCKCQERKPLPSAKLCEKYGGASVADGCQESRQSSGSWRACGICECHADRGGNVSAFGDEPASSLSDHLQEIPNVVSTTSTMMEQSSTLVSLSTWLVGYMRHICGLLACLATRVPSIRLDEHDEANQRNMDVDHEPELVCSADGSNIANSEPNLEPKHKIFLSHSGAQKDFVEQLCVDLEQCDRYPFFDKRRSSLPIGEKFPKLIFDAIEQCWVGVVVLSEQFFTRSKWPMLELNAMVKELDKPDSSIRIIPVYYLISLEALKDEKNHRRWMSKWKGWAFKDKRINVTEWYKSIRFLGSLSSLVAKGGNGDVKLRKRIVTEICQLVPLDLELDDSFIQGRARTCKVFEERMDQVCTSSSVGMIGLFGMGGIGKTTICKALCKHLRKKFRDDVCHIELGSSTEMKSLQKALKRFSEIRHDIVDNMDDVEQGVAILRRKCVVIEYLFS